MVNEDPACGQQSGHRRRAVRAASAPFVVARKRRRGACRGACLRKSDFDRRLGPGRPGGQPRPPQGPARASQAPADSCERSATTSRMSFKPGYIIRTCSAGWRQLLPAEFPLCGEFITLLTVQHPCSPVPGESCKSWLGFPAQFQHGSSVALNLPGAVMWHSATHPAK